MKTPKRFLAITLAILFTSLSYAQEPAIVTLVSSKNIKNATELFVDLDGEIITDTWSKSNMVRLEIEIKTNDASREVIKHLITKMRFVVKTLTLEDGSTIIYMPNLKLPVYINGRRLSEDINYRLLVPENVIVKIKTWGEYM